MLQLVKASLSFLTTVEKIKLFSLIFLRALLALLDLAGILAIGFLVTSTAVALTAGTQAPDSLRFAGLEIPTVNSGTLPLVSAAVLALFLVKAFLSIILTKKAAFFVARIEARASKKIAEISFGGDLGDARKRSREEMMFAIQAGSPAAFNVLLNSINTFITETTLFIEEEDDDLTDLNPSETTYDQLLSCMEQSINAESGRLDHVNEEIMQ